MAYKIKRLLNKMGTRRKKKSITVIQIFSEMVLKIRHFKVLKEFIVLFFKLKYFYFVNNHDYSKISSLFGKRKTH